MQQYALCYVRKSVVKNASDEISPERQRFNVTREAERRGFVAEVYEDAEGHQSGRTEKRRGWLTLKAQLDRPEVKAVIVESLSRASRSIRDLYNFVHDLEARDIALISLKEQFDTTSAMGRAFLGVIATLNQFESDIASERSAMNIKFLQHDKGRHWGMTPFGCDRKLEGYDLLPTRKGVYWINGALVVAEKDNPPFAKGKAAQWRGYHDALNRCYEIFLENKFGYVKIHFQLNAEGYRFRDRNGMPRLFQKDDIRRLVWANRVYAGFISLGASKNIGSKIIKGNHEPILSVDLCDRVAEVLAERHSTWARGGGGKPKHVYLFRNLFCAECGQRVTGQFDFGKRLYRHHDAKKCPSRKYHISADEIEEQVWRYLDVLGSSEEMKQKIRARALRLVQSVDAGTLTSAEQAVKRVVGSLDRLKELYVEGAIGKTEYDRQFERYNQQLGETKGKLGTLAPDLRKVEQLLSRMDRVMDVVREGNLEQQREALDALIERAEEKDGQLVRVIYREWVEELHAMQG